MAKKISDTVAIIWQTSVDGGYVLNGEPALLVRTYNGMIGIYQEDKEELLINIESFPFLRKIMKAMETDGDLKGLKF